MAIVVRDGGRPPERRWQLFNSFYLVMKKRESQKNFQNPRIAKLLREEDRLLKSVHMRLGFVLHARAEQSQGAQTALSKKDFQSLVNDVVTELVDHEVENTVADVMEATTERLVLVSTPEDGQQVRFDIRQLQEFFAAEFLYAGVDADELASRIETIGGDEHWREVMHFLMSALIENQRTADVAVAVEELRRLNEGEGPDDLYRRRVAKAVSLGSRLLVEGVLEQDQRDRQRMKPLFDPLGSVFDLNILQPLARIKATRSRQWLIHLLVEKIETVKPQEYIGALYLLAWLLPNDHKDATRVLEAFFIAPIKCQENLFNFWHSEEMAFEYLKSSKNKNKEPFSQWVIEGAINILNSSEWLKYSPLTIRHLLSICSTTEADRFISICRIKGLSDDAALAISQCLKHYGSIHEVRTSTKLDIDCGVLKGYIFPENWSNGTIPKHLESIHAQKCLIETNGAFRLMLTCVWFAESHSDAALVEIVQAVDAAGGNLIATLPDILLALLPIPGSHSIKPFDIEHLRIIDSTSINQGISIANTQGIPLPITSLTIKRKANPTIRDWKSLATHLPGLVANIVFNSLSDDYFTWGEKGAFVAISVPEIRNVLLRDINRTCAYICSWGILLEQHSCFLDELKISAKALGYQRDNAPWILTEQCLRPFTLKLPEDVPLIPFIASALIKWVVEPQRYRFNRTANEQRSSLKHILNSYGLDENILRGIAESKINTREARAGALALFWLITAESSQLQAPHIMPDLIREKALYAELANAVNEKWLTLSLVKGVLSNMSENDPNVLGFVTLLIERCIDGGGPQDELKILLSDWRERSTAPVHAKGVLKKWLGYNFQPPNYVRA